MEGSGVGRNAEKIGDRETDDDEVKDSGAEGNAEKRIKGREKRN